MKIILTKSLLLITFFTISFIFPQVEFDGGYLETTKGKYIELDEIRCSVLKKAKLSGGFEGHFKSLGGSGGYYIVRNQMRDIVTISQKDFKGVVAKG